MGVNPGCSRSICSNAGPQDRNANVQQNTGEEAAFLLASPSALVVSEKPTTPFTARKSSHENGILDTDMQISHFTDTPHSSTDDLE